MNNQEIERLIKISLERPLLPEAYIPWNEELKPGEVYLPEELNSLQGLLMYNSLSVEQKLDLGRHEIVQVLYSYAWGEGLFCQFMGRYLAKLDPDNIERRFLEIEVAEEYRHQDMFKHAIKQLNGEVIQPSGIHKFFGGFTAKLMPSDLLFMGSLAVELVTDTYGDYSRKHPDSYLVLKKVFDLHSIEEGRHIYFTKNMLKRYTDKAGYIRRSVYSFIILFNIYFIRTLYVRKEIYWRIGLEHPGAVYKEAFKNYKTKFTQIGLAGVIDFVDSWGGFTGATRWAWKWLMGVDAPR